MSPKRRLRITKKRSRRKEAEQNESEAQIEEQGIGHKAQTAERRMKGKIEKITGEPTDILEFVLKEMTIMATTTTMYRASTLHRIKRTWLLGQGIHNNLRDNHLLIRIMGKTLP